MSYRDDREALRQRNEQLERELAATRAQLARQRDQDLQQAEDRTPPRAAVVTLAIGAVLVVALLAERLGGPVVLPLLAFPLALVVVLVRQLVVAPPHTAVLLFRARRGRRVRGRALRLPLIEREQRFDLSVRSLRAGTGADALIVHARVVDPVRLSEQGYDSDSWASAAVRGVENAQRAEQDASLDGVRQGASEALDELGVQLTGLWRAREGEGQD
jgi:hypothetical protein